MRPRSLNRWLACVLGSLLLSPLAARADEMSFHAIRLGSEQVCGDTCPAAIEAVGRITSDTPGRFLAFLRGRGHLGPDVVFLDSPGGGVLASMEFGVLLRQLGATAIVARVAADDRGGAVMVSGQCFSACVYALVGARKRIVPNRSEVGIHRMFLVEEGVDANGGTTLVRRRHFDNGDARAMLTRYTGQMGVSPALIEAAERVPSNDLKIVSRAELRRWHLAASAF